jgi:drug/metabolite transporter (DMT)-like permease
MATLFALVATFLTSFLPILNKRLLRDARPTLVAWAINAASLPILAGGTLLLTQCSLTGRSCTVQLPHIDTIFVIALLASVVLNWAATLLSTMALSKADASLVSPLLTFNPAFTLLVAWFSLGEVPGVRQSIGVAVVLFGAYLLEAEEARTGPLAPVRVLVRRPGVLLAVLASALWGTTTVLEKLSIDHMSPPSGPVVALLGTFLMVLLLTPGAFRFSGNETTPGHQNRWKGLLAHPRVLVSAVLIAGIAPLFGFTAIALGFVGVNTQIK